MNIRRLAASGVIVGAVLLSTSSMAVAQPATPAPSDYSSLRDTLKTVTLPTIEQPEWLTQQLAQEAAAAAAIKRAPSKIVVFYQIATRGSVSGLAEFKLLANQTLNDARGWARLNLRFVEVDSGGSFTLTLATAEEVGAVPGCGAEYSCRSGGSVLINQDRWNGATPSWNQAGGSLRDYRHMVVNHEVGHWLGHDHSQCGGAGQLAPVMQQQSIDLQGCSFNPWPLDSELNAPQLGI